MVDSVYIHIPFCKKICTYCDFCKVFYNDKWTINYLDALEYEIKEKYQKEEINTLYIGGGTPSSLNEKELNKLFNIINNNLNLSKTGEYTFECNINDINDNLLNILKNNKVNRLSIGIESFNQNNLKFLGRDNKDVFNKIKLAKKYFNNINVDLIYAIPKESYFTLIKDLTLFNKLHINHISLYSLILEPNTVLNNNHIENIKEDKDYKMYQIICKYLKLHHFNHYEVSNFAKKGYESKHNSKYWENKRYYGFGVGASGYLNNIRYENTKSITSYIKHKYQYNEEILEDKDIRNYELMLGFRLLKGINVEEYNQKYHTNLRNEYHINELIKQGLLKENNGNIYIPENKMYLMNEILIRL